MTNNPYKILGVNRNASYEEIKKAYRQQIKRYHPDLGGDEEKTKLINNAWAILSDEKKKTNFDNSYATTNDATGTNQKQNWSSSWWHEMWNKNRSNQEAYRSNQSRSNNRSNQEAYRSNQSRSNNRSSQEANYTDSNINRGTFRAICICGCMGYPLTHLPEYSIDYEKYKSCPSRFLRKKLGYYYDNSGKKVIWQPSWYRRVKRETRKTNQQQKKRRDKEKRAYERKQKDILKSKEEEYRIKNRLVPLSPAEARRRNIKFYKGRKCKYGHDSLRDLKGNCLACRKLEYSRQKQKTNKK